MGFLRGNIIKYGRAPHGARGLKQKNHYILHIALRRAPHGARGLKPHDPPTTKLPQRSRPAWGAWIETPRPGTCTRGTRRAPHGARGLKLQGELSRSQYIQSRPARARGLKLKN